MDDCFPTEPEALHDDLRLDPRPSIPVHGDECPCPQCLEELTEAVRVWFSKEWA